MTQRKAKSKKVDRTVGPTDQRMIADLDAGTFRGDITGALASKVVPSRQKRKPRRSAGK